MINVIDIGALIVRTPEMRGGRPRMAGTGITVRRIVANEDAVAGVFHAAPMPPRVRAPRAIGTAGG